jgi:hypothetical protein
MMRIQIMIDELSMRAEERDLISLLATRRNARLYNAYLARALRDVVGALKKNWICTCPTCAMIRLRQTAPIVPPIEVTAPY